MSQMALDTEIPRPTSSQGPLGHIPPSSGVVLVCPVNCTSPPAEVLTQWANLQTALIVESHGMDDEEAFSPAAKTMPIFEWARVYLYSWPAIQWLCSRFPGLACSASGCEHRCVLFSDCVLTGPAAGALKACVALDSCHRL